jgi:predicted lactoylglutathione lyase
MFIGGTSIDQLGHLAVWTHPSTLIPQPRVAISMPVDESEIAAAAEAFHEDVSHEFQVSLSMSLNTRNDLDAIQDEVNEILGERVFTTNDAMRVALLAAARYNEFATGEKSDLDTLDEEQLVPLTSAIRTVVEEESAHSDEG